MRKIRPENVRFALLMSLACLLMVGSTFSYGQEYAYFDSKEHSQLSHLSLQFEYPADWELALSSDDMMIAEMGTAAGIVDVLCLFLWLEPDGVMDPASIEYTLSPEGLREMIPDGSVPIRTFPSSIDGRQSGTIDFTQERLRGDVPVRLHLRMITLLEADYVFQFGCGTRGLQADDADHQMVLFDQHAGVFERIQRSIRVSKPASDG